MQKAAYGIIKEGQIIFNEPVNIPENTNVIVVFLDDQNVSTSQNEISLVDIFKILGPWEDSKDAETTINEIEKSRVSRKVNITLWNIY